MNQRWQLIEERAENYTYSQLEEFNLRTSYHSPMTDTIYDALLPYKDPRVRIYLGGKGTGKTYTAMQAVRNLVRRTRHLPVLCGFKKNEEFEILGPEHFTSDKDWGQERLEAYELPDERLIDEADMVVFDDFHYMCEYVIDGTIPIEYLIDALETVIEALKRHRRKKCLLVSEYQIRYYANIFMDDRFDKLTMELGDIPPRLYEGMHWKEILRTRREQQQRKPITHEYGRKTLESIAKCTGYRISGKVVDWLSKHSNLNPRIVVAFLKEFPETDIITVVQLADRARKKLREKGADDMLDMMDKYPFAIPTTRGNRIYRMVREFGGPRDIQRYMRRIGGQHRDLAGDVREIKRVAEREQFTYYDESIGEVSRPDVLLQLFDQIDEVKRFMQRADQVERWIRNGGAEFWRGAGAIEPLNEKLPNFGISKIPVSLTGWKANYYREYEELEQVDEADMEDIWKMLRAGHYSAFGTYLLLDKPLKEAFDDVLYRKECYLTEETITMEEYKKMVKEAGMEGVEGIDIDAATEIS